MDAKIFPNSMKLQEAVLECLRESSTPLSNEEIEKLVIRKLQLGKEITEIIKSGTRTELEYRLAWTRTKLKSRGLILRTGNKTWCST